MSCSASSSSPICIICGDGCAGVGDGVIGCDGVVSLCLLSGLLSGLQSGLHTSGSRFSCFLIGDGGLGGFLGG